MYGNHYFKDIHRLHFFLFSSIFFAILLHFVANITRFCGTLWNSVSYFKRICLKWMQYLCSCLRRCCLKAYPYFPYIANLAKSTQSFSFLKRTEHGLITPLYFLLRDFVMVLSRALSLALIYEVMITNQTLMKHESKTILMEPKSCYNRIHSPSSLVTNPGICTLEV